MTDFKLKLKRGRVFKYNLNIIVEYRVTLDYMTFYLSPFYIGRSQQNEKIGGWVYFIFNGHSWRLLTPEQKTKELYNNIIEVEMTGRINNKKLKEELFKENWVTKSLLKNYDLIFNDPLEFIKPFKTDKFNRILFFNNKIYYLLNNNLKDDKLRNYIEELFNKEIEEELRIIKLKKLKQKIIN